MAKFCSKCGTKLDETTGLCPNCDKKKRKKSVSQEKTIETKKTGQKVVRTSKDSLSKKELKKKYKEEKKEAKKAKKKEKRARLTTGQKVCRFFLKLVLSVFFLFLVIVGAIGGLVYFEIVDMPEVSYILQRSGLKKREIVSTDPSVDNYIPGEDTIVFDEEKKIFYANNEIIVVFSNNATDIQKKEVISYLNGELVGTIPELSMYQIKIRSCDTLEELVYIADEIQDKFDYVIYATYDSATVNQDEVYAPNDPWNGDVTIEDWGDTTVDGSNWWTEAIALPNAWDYSNRFSKISIGICDSSFDVGHEDLRNKVSFPNEILKSRNIVTPWWYDFENLKHLKSWSVSNQENYHGTHVAGIIGAEGDNKKGITGIVQNCELLLAPYYRSENMEAYLAWDSSTYANLSYLVKVGAKVINFSQGKTNFLEESTNQTAYDKNVIEREGNLAAVSISQLIDSGYDNFIVVQSAGNGTGDTGKALDAIQNGWFASITNSSITGYENISIKEVLSRVIIVGAAEQTSTGFQCASFSNYGTQVDICAPGVKIYSTIPGEIFYDFQFTGGYGFASGTSMAAPIVTGVCALTWSANSNLSAKQVKDIVCNNNNMVVQPNPESDSDISYKMINAELSVKSALHYTTDDNQFNQRNTTDIPSDAVEFNGHYYYLYDSGTASSYEEALQYCQDKGGYLATLTSQEENDFVYAYLGYKNCANAYFGLSDAANEGTWEWCTGEEVFYTNWNSGEPNDENPEEDYGEFYFKYPDGKWNDGDFGNSTAGDTNAFLCEWGDYTVQQTGGSGGQKTTSDERDVVLVLDASGSMAGTPLEETKKASSKFINTVLEQDASIGIVTYDEIANRVSEFSMNQTALQNAVSEVGDGGGTNIEAGLYEARSMLQTSNAKKKIIVLMSDGEPNNGKVGEDLIAYADEIKKEEILIYTIGFFESLTEKSDAQRLMEQLASDGCHYEVAKADDLVFFFEDMADQINGQKYIYVRIACPVDVSVTYNGQTLSSSDRDSNFRTDFGTLTFEEKEVDSSEEAEEDYEETGEIDDRIKVLRLKEGVDYDLKLTGTGRGVMNYTIGFMDEDGNYSDLRKFKNIRVSRRTTIDTVAAVSPESILNIDEDGDGKYDIKMRAEENGYGEEIKTPAWVIYAMCVAGILIVIDIFIIVILRATKKRKVRR